MRHDAQGMLVGAVQELRAAGGLGHLGKQVRAQLFQGTKVWGFVLGGGVRCVSVCIKNGHTI